MNLFKLVGAGLLLAALYGCGTYQAVRGTVVDRGRDVAETAVEDAEFVLCDAAPVGTLKRLYWSDPNKRFAWATFCSVDDAELP